MKNQTKEELLKKIQQLENKLIENEQIFKLLIESTGNMVSLHDKEGKYTHYKGPSTSVLREDQLIGKMPSDLFNEKEAKKIISGIKAAFNSGKSSQFETVLNYKKKQKKFLEKIYPIFKNETVIAAAKICSDITPTKNEKNELNKNAQNLQRITENGKVVSIISSSNNINKQNIAELKLTESEEKFSKSFYEHPSPMQIINIKTGEQVEANNSFLKLTGYDWDEYQKRNLYKQSIAYDKEKLKELIFKIKKDGVLTEEPFKIVTKSREVISTLLSIAPLNIKDKNLIISSYTDVTESNRILEELKFNKNYLEKLTNSMADIVFSVKMPERKIEWVSDSIITMGYKPNECIGKNTSFLFPTQESYAYYGIKVKKALINKKKFLQIRQKLIKKNGEKFTADIITSFILEKNNVISVTSIIRDISSKIKEEKELEKYRNHLEELVLERTQELKEKNEALDENLKIFVGREQKIKKLEEQIQKLKKNQLVN